MAPAVTEVRQTVQHNARVGRGELVCLDGLCGSAARNEARADRRRATRASRRVPAWTTDWIRKVRPMTSNDREEEAEVAMDEADEANGEGRPDEDAANDTERKYGQDESPA